MTEPEPLKKDFDAEYDTPKGSTSLILFLLGLVAVGSYWLLFRL